MNFESSQYSGKELEEKVKQMCDKYFGFNGHTAVISVSPIMLCEITERVEENNLSIDMFSRIKVETLHLLETIYLEFKRDNIKPDRSSKKS